MVTPLLGPVARELLRDVVADYTVDGVEELLGPIGRSAHQRGDLHGVSRALPAGERLSTLVRLFLLGEAVDEADARSALLPLGLDEALVERSAGSVRARLELRPYAQQPGPPWWVFSDFGSDVRPGPLAPDHVLGIGSASLTLAQAVPRSRVGRALDLGTGCGVQALHLGTHAETIVATDVSDRALQLAATTAAVSSQVWDLRKGSLLEPVDGELFDLIVANPPFVVSPGLARDTGGFDYRDSGLAGDGVSEALLRGLPGHLAPGGRASVLANWIVPSDGDWGARLRSWLDGSGCDTWVWQREVVEPGAYVAMWLRDAGEQPGTARWAARYDTWLGWFADHGVAAIGMGHVTMWRGGSPGDPAGGCPGDYAGDVVCEDVPQTVEQPSGAHLDAWVTRHRWLARHDDAALLASRLACAPDLVRTRQDLRTDAGWTTRTTSLRESHGMRWELETDEAIAGLVAACDGSVPLGLVVDMLAAVRDRPSEEVAAAAVPVVRDLIARGFLEPGAGSA